jgi:hypothetical protein
MAQLELAACHGGTAWMVLGLVLWLQQVMLLLLLLLGRKVVQC